MSARFFALTGALALLAAAPTTAHAAAYGFTTLDNPADVTFNQLLGINAAGTIAGYFGSGAAGFPNKGYTLSNGTYTNENFPGSVQTQVTGINDSGTTVGFWSNTNMGVGMDANFGFTDVGGHFVNVVNPNTPVAALTFNQLLGVNNAGTAVGFYTDAGGNNHGYTYNVSSHAFSTDINAPGATSTTTAAINNAGTIAGFAMIGGITAGFVDTAGVFTIVNAPNAIVTDLLGINDNGLAVGFDMDANNVMHGILYNVATNTLTTLDDPLGIGTTTFNGINDLNQIVGFYVDGNGFTDGLLATPISTSVPEPATAALLAGGLLGLAAARRSKIRSPRLS